MLAKLPPERQVLLDAANILEEQGWIRGNLCRPEGYCILGAMDAAKPPAAAMVIAFMRLEKKLGPPAQWNDTPGRTKEEVIAMLRETALDGL
jgi:hypothetical protein